MLLKILYEELMFCSQEEDERDHIYIDLRRNVAHATEFWNL